MSSGGSEDFYSTDEVKVYKDEGEEEKRSSENLNEEKLGLVTESEEGKNGNFSGAEKSSSTVPDDEKSSANPAAPGPPGSLGFFIPPYGAYPNPSMLHHYLQGKFSMVQPPYPAGLVMYNEFAQPPPAHKGYPPVYTDPKTGLPRPPMYAAYPAPPGQFPHPLYSPELTSAYGFPALPSHRGGYPLSAGAFAGSFPPSLASLSRYGHPGLLHPGLAHHGIPHPASLGGGKDLHMSPQLLQDSHRYTDNSGPPDPPQKKKNHIKKPLNAFMLFMKEQRPKVIAECTLRESSAINQILGRRWHALDRSEQSKYYEMARKEKELHLQLYPGWSARDNYAAHQKKKKRKKDCPSGMMGMGSPGMGMGGGARPEGHMGSMGHMDTENKPDLGFPFSPECPNEKKCRARYGMEQQNRWCKPCRRKKKCIRYKQSHHSDSEREGEDETEEEDSFMRNRTLDSSILSGCESDSTINTTATHDSPRHHKLPKPSRSHSNDEFDDKIDSSPLSPIMDEEEDEENFEEKIKREPWKPQARPLSLVVPSPVHHHSPHGRLNIPTTSSPRPPQRRLTPHNVDSFLFSPPPLRLPPYGLPPSPLALPMPYIGFPPFHPHPLSPHTPSGGSPFSPLDLKPIL